MKLDLIREHYFHEQNRRMAIDSATTFPVAMLVILGGLVAYYLQIIPLPSCQLIFVRLFYLLLIVGVICLGIAGWYIVLSFIRRRYLDLASMGEWLDYHEELEAYVNYEGDTTVNPDESLEYKLKHKYAEAVDRYSGMNIARMSNLYWARVFLALAALPLLFCAFPYFTIKCNNEDSIYKVQIIDDSGFSHSIRSSTMSQDSNKPPNATQSTPPPKKTPPPPKPTPPPNRETRDGSPTPK